MAMTVVVTRDVPLRFRGFLASCMLEVAPGVYTAPRMNKGIRERVWSVLETWFGETMTGNIVMTWSDSSVCGGQGLKILGSPPQNFVDYDGLFLVRKDVEKSESETKSIPGQQLDGILADPPS
jgi:CRISPR-associated protein Cas2